MRLRAILIAICCVQASACSGGTSGTVPNLSTTQRTSQAVAPASASGRLLTPVPTHVIPAYQPSPDPNEQLIVLSTECFSQFGDTCSPGEFYYSLINTYSLSSGNGLYQISLQPGYPPGATQTVASVGNEYFLSSILTTQGGVEVDKPNGFFGAIPWVGSLLMSTDLTTALVLTSDGKIVSYRAPFLSASGGGTISTGAQPATNSNGSQIFVASANGKTVTATIYSITTHKTTRVSWATNQQVVSSPPATGLYDARRAWYYITSQSSSTVGTPNRIEIVDVARGKYLGYITVPGFPSGVAVDPTSSDLYVSIGSKIYVYNVGECGCTAPRRVLTSPLAGAQIAIDRNNQHLITYALTYNANGSWQTQFYDLNPQTGGRQRQFPSVNGNPYDQVFVNSVLAQ